MHQPLYQTISESSQDTAASAKHSELIRMVPGEQIQRFGRRLEHRKETELPALFWCLMPNPLLVWGWLGLPGASMAQPESVAEVRRPQRAVASDQARNPFSMNYLNTHSPAVKAR